MSKHTRVAKIRRTALRLASLHTDASIVAAERLVSDLASIETAKQRIFELTDASTRLDEALKNHWEIEEKELRAKIERVRNLEWDWAFMDGLKEGFLIAQQQFKNLPKIERKLKGARGPRRAPAVIFKILSEQPNLSTAKLFKEMDARKIPVFAYGRLFPGPGFRKWTDVSQESAFKNLVAKARKSVRLNIRCQTWKSLLGPRK